MKIGIISDSTVTVEIETHELSEKGIALQNLCFESEYEKLMTWVFEKLESAHVMRRNGLLMVQIVACSYGINIMISKQVPNQLFDDIDSFLPFLTASDEYFEPAEKEPQRSKSGVLIQFEDFEDVIQLAKRIQPFHSLTIPNELYYYEGRYFLNIGCYASNDGERILDFLSIVKEYGEKTTKALPLIEAYGKKVAFGNALEEMAVYFA
ncbi:adaptor protein MecA [Priestia abyssalis]|uniref:adaptor protein MecA n=1 Tax=Priestia abyssalis TaxID=1221450 RepID=UPI001472C30D|nr:adaptor protein MecA [Priestia abyssalis]